MSILALGGCGGAAGDAPPPARVTPIDVLPAPAPASSTPPAMATAAATANAPPSGNAPSTGTCASECRAQPSKALIEAISVAARQAHRCYDQALAQDRSLRGHVQIHLTVAHDGHVCTAIPEKPLTDAPMSAVAECVAGVFRARTLVPPLDEGCSDLSLPIAFVPRTDDAGAP